MSEHRKDWLKHLASCTVHIPQSRHHTPRSLLRDVTIVDVQSLTMALPSSSYLIVAVAAHSVAALTMAFVPPQDTGNAPDGSHSNRSIQLPRCSQRRPQQRRWPESCRVYVRLHPSRQLLPRAPAARGAPVKHNGVGAAEMVRCCLVHPSEKASNGPKIRSESLCETPGIRFSSRCQGPRSYSSLNVSTEGWRLASNLGLRNDYRQRFNAGAVLPRHSDSATH